MLPPAGCLPAAPNDCDASYAVSQTLRREHGGKTSSGLTITTSRGRGQRGVVRGHGQWGIARGRGQGALPGGMVRGCGQGTWPGMRYKRYDNVFLKINTIRISFVLLFQFGILQYNWKVESNN